MVECLLVDRDAVERGRVVAHLEGLGLKIVEREAVADALRYCNDNRPDVVLMASRGLEIKTVDFIRRMRKTGKGTRPVVIVYGPQSHVELVGQTILDGAADFIMLPADHDILRFKLRQAGIL